MRKMLGFTLFILTVSSTFQYGDILISRYFVPMIGVAFAALVFLIGCARMSMYQNQVMILHLAFYFLFVLLSFLGHSTVEEFGFDLVKLALAFSLSFFAFYYISMSEVGDVKVALNGMFLFVFLFLFLESYGRLLPLLSDLSVVKQNFYLAKINSPFMVDSNAVGLFALFYLVAYISAQNVLSHGYLTRLVFLIGFSAFILLTLSRAAIFTSVFILLLYCWKLLPRVARYIVGIIGIVAFVYVSYLLLSFIFSDGSGTTKLGVIYNIPDLMRHIDIRGVLLGFGINEGNYVYSYEEGKYSHLLIPMIMGQFGVVGVLLYAFFFYFLNKMAEGRLFFLIVTMLVVGLSYLHPFLETIFLVAGICLGLGSFKCKVS